MGQLIGRTEIANMLGVCQQTVMNRLAAGTLPPPVVVTDNGWRFWNREDIQQVIDKQKQVEELRRIADAATERIEAMLREVRT